MDPALHKFGAAADAHKRIARRFVLRALLFALIFTGLHFLYVYNVGVPCSHGQKCPSRPKFDVSSPLGDRFPHLSTGFMSGILNPRYNFKTHEEYVQLQLRRKLSPKLRSLWTSKEWRGRVGLFSRVFQDLMQQNILSSWDKALCIASGEGQEVLALREVGVLDSIGTDVRPSPPLVVKGDLNILPFEDNTFDFEFFNDFGRALYPATSASEIERTLKPGGIAVLHLFSKKGGDIYSLIDFNNIDSVAHFFKKFDVVSLKEIDAFGLKREIVLRKRNKHAIEAQSPNCPLSQLKQKIIRDAEPIILEEPLKPWITFKENAKAIKYLPVSRDISNHRSFVYVDVGARSYGSSIGSWFVKRYPKQNQKFVLYAVEADDSFAGDYLKRKNVQLLPYAAWLRNESLVFGANPENKAVEGAIGMGRIQSRSALQNDASGRQFKVVQGFDFAEWLNNTVSPDDFVVLKMDVEGTEFDLLPRMLETGAICLVDELFLECHYNRWQRTSPTRTSKYNKTYGDCVSLFKTLRSNGVLVHQWW